MALLQWPILKENHDSIFVPKIHLFFTQGTVICGCLSKDDPQHIHLEINGDKICPECSTAEYNQTMFPLIFCKQCGMEYYGVKQTEEGTLSPEYYNPFIIGDKILLCKASNLAQNRVDFPIPDNWLTKDQSDIKNQYQDKVPIKARYCPICN